MTYSPEALKITEVEILKRIEKDIARARSDQRLDDVMFHLDEVVPFFLFTADPSARRLCEAILSRGLVAQKPNSKTAALN